MSHCFHLYLKVVDAQELRTAAIERAIEEGLSFEEASAESTIEDGGVDVNWCLVMLLDPGTLAGCSILDSGATSDDAV